MRVKRFVADTAQQAIARVKRDLGDDALILHSRPFKEGGFLGLFAKRRYEVLAAVDNKETMRMPARESPTVKGMRTTPVAPTRTGVILRN